MILYSKKELLVKVFHAYGFNIFKMFTIKLLKYFILLHRSLNISDSENDLRLDKDASKYNTNMHRLRYKIPPLLLSVDGRLALCRFPDLH